MKRLFATMAVTAALVTTPSLSSAAKKPLYKDPKAPIEARVDDLLSRMTLHEKVQQLQNNSVGRVDEIPGRYGKVSPGSVHEMGGSAYDAAVLFTEMQKYLADSTRLGIPALTSVEGIHGIIQNGCTIFPQAIALGATFNPSLVERMTAAEAAEARVMGISQFLSPVLDIARELRWGRVEETYGEDPYLIGEMATAFVNGAQKNGVGCMPKHFVAHGTPTGGLNCATVAGGEHELRNLYAYPFAKVFKNAHPIAVMSCYSAYDGVPMTGSHYYMTEFLRDELGFDGFVYSDWGSVDRIRVFHNAVATPEEAGRQCLIAGIDMEVSSGTYGSFEDQVRNGLLDEKYIDIACRRVLEAKFKLGLFDNAGGQPEKVAEVVRCPEHVALAKEIADESVVLLENDGILPLDVKKYKSVAVLGPNSNYGIAGDYGWVGRDDKECVTLYDALKEKLAGKAVVNQLDGCDWWSQDDSSIAAAADLAAKSDLAVVAVGTRSWWLGRNAKGNIATSGEGFDLSSLDLPGRQLDLLKAVKATGKPMIVVLITGKPLVMSWAKENADAVLVQFYGGEQQGNALADVLLGDVNPSGKLNVSFPRSTGNTPCYYNYYTSDRENIYDKGGSPEEPNLHYVFEKPYALWNFGHGKSYTTFEYSEPVFSGDTFGPDGTLTVTVDVTNTGDRDGKEVVQLYVQDKISTVSTPDQMLRAFDKQLIPAGETRTFTLTLPMEELKLYNIDRKYVVEPGEFEIQIGAASDDIKSRKTITVK
ncbi:MAG: glycoside hydrolase family 3 C-terminal domain-containing protein [Duncaniella sp.]|nr:glycoside hydrolase family 3 C-terminal domain-containing protein [Duncaniella sp.]